MTHLSVQHLAGVHICLAGNTFPAGHGACKASLLFGTLLPSLFHEPSCCPAVVASLLTVMAGWADKGCRAQCFD